jgi:hypothetical protein
MTLDELYQVLYDYSRWNNGEKLQDLLEKFGRENSYKEVNLLHLDGLFWEIAIAHEAPNALNMLLEYYKKIHLVADVNELEYKVARHKLLDTLAKAADSYCVTEEVQKVLNQYISARNDDSDNERLQGLEDEYPTSSQDEDSYESGGSSNLTAENLEKLGNILVKGEELGEGVELCGEGELVDLGLH